MVGNFGHIPSHQHALLLASSICWRTLKFDRQRKQAIIKVARGGEVQVRRGDVGGGGGGGGGGGANTEKPAVIWRPL